MNRDGLEKAAILFAALSKTDQERIIERFAPETADALRAEVAAIGHQIADAALQDDFLSAWHNGTVAEKRVETKISGDVCSEKSSDAEHEVLSSNDDNCLVPPSLDDVAEKQIRTDEFPYAEATDKVKDIICDNVPLYRIDHDGHDMHVPRFVSAHESIQDAGDTDRSIEKRQLSQKHRLTAHWKIPEESSSTLPQAETIPADTDFRESLFNICLTKERPQTIAAWLSQLSVKESESILHQFSEPVQGDIRRRLEKIEGIDSSVVELLGRCFGRNGGEEWRNNE